MRLLIFSKISVSKKSLIDTKKHQQSIFKYCRVAIFEFILWLVGVFWIVFDVRKYWRKSNVDVVWIFNFFYNVDDGNGVEDKDHWRLSFAYIATFGLDKTWFKNKSSGDYAIWFDISWVWAVGYVAVTFQLLDCLSWNWALFLLFDPMLPVPAKSWLA